MFDLEQFTADCRAARTQDSSSKAVREVVAALSLTLQQSSKDWASRSAVRFKRSTAQMISPS